MNNSKNKAILRNRRIKPQQKWITEVTKVISNSQVEYNSSGSQVDDVHISNDLSSLILFGETISPIARANFYESVVTKSSSKKENSERKLLRASKENSNHSTSTRYEPILRVSNYGSQSSPVSKQSSHKSSMNIVRSYSPKQLFSCCCCCCWYLRCRRCCCGWNLFRFDRYNIEQNFRRQNKRHNSRNKKRTIKKAEE